MYPRVVPTGGQWNAALECVPNLTTSQQACSEYCSNNAWLMHGSVLGQRWWCLAVSAPGMVESWRWCWYGHLACMGRAADTRGVCQPRECTQSMMLGTGVLRQRPRHSCFGRQGVNT
jgi:hypothetical protein